MLLLYNFNDIIMSLFWDKGLFIQKDMGALPFGICQPAPKGQKVR